MTQEEIHQMLRRLFVLVPFLISSPALAQNGSNPSETLQQYVSELRQNTDDVSLREQIIRAALALDPQPAIPEEARRHFVRAVTIQKDATSEADAELAAREYREALLLAPWWGDAYFNLGVAAQTANLFDEAIRAFRLYLLTQPPSDDARDAQDRIYAVEAKRELARSADVDRQMREARAQMEREAANRQTLQRLVGQWRTMLPLGSGRHILDNCNYYNFETRGNEIIATAIHTPYTDPRNCGRQRPPLAHLRITVDGDQITAQILPPLLGSGTVMTGTVDFNEFKVYGPDNTRWELYRQGTYPVFHPGDCTAALC
jgi:tetratricopeptide (TPR) repeat protein